MHRRECIFHGRVQGVGFRATVAHLAKNWKVTGFVRNLSEGNVELIIEGDDEQLSGLINAIEQTVQKKIAKMTMQSLPASGKFQGFSIRY